MLLAGIATAHVYGTSWTSKKDQRTQCSLTFLVLQTISLTQHLEFPELCESSHCVQGKGQSRKRNFV